MAAVNRIWIAGGVGGHRGSSRLDGDCWSAHAHSSGRFDFEIDVGGVPQVVGDRAALGDLVRRGLVFLPAFVPAAGTQTRSG